MINTKQIEITQDWKKKIKGDIVDILSVGRKKPIVIGLIDGCYLVSPSSKVVKSLSVKSEPVLLRSNQTSSCFAVMDADDNVSGFDCSGENIWKHHCENAQFISLGPGNELLANKPPYDIFFIDPESDGGGQKFKSIFIPSSFELINNDPVRIAIGGDKGELGLLNGDDGGFEWDIGLAIPIAAISYDPDSKTIIVPAFEDGIYSYSLDGTTQENYDLGASVSKAKIVSTSAGVIIAAAVDEQKLVLFDPENETFLWEYDFAKTIAHWDFSNDGTVLVMTSATGEIETFSIDYAPEQTSIVSAEHVEDESVVSSIQDGEISEEYQHDSVAAHSHRNAELLGEAPLMGGLLPKGDGKIHMTPSGNKTACILPGGEAIVLDTEGNLFLESRLAPPARILKTKSEEFFAAWNSSKFVVFNNEKKKVHTDEFSQNVIEVDSSDRLDTIAYINQKKELVLRCDGQKDDVLRKELPWQAQKLRVSPDGNTLLIEDRDSRFHILSNEGQVMRKQKFGGDLRFDYVLLLNKHCVFASKKGPLMIQTIEGEVVFAKKITGKINSVYNINGLLAVEEQSGRCRLIKADGDSMWEFEPPPGLRLLRMPDGKDPIILVAKNKLLTAYSGYKKSLTVMWAFKCEDNIESVASNEGGTVVALAAGERIYFVSPNV